MSAASTRSLSEYQIERFARQIIVPGVGAEGQMRLCAAEVFVDGHPEGARVATQYLRAAGVRVGSATNPPSHLDCVVLAGAGSLPTDRVQLLIHSAPLLAWYALVEHGIRGGLANASRGLSHLSPPVAAPAAHGITMAHRIAGADVAATAVAALLGWIEVGDSYEVELA